MSHHLSGDEHHAVGLDGLGVGAHSAWGLVGAHHLAGCTSRPAAAWCRGSVEHLIQEHAKARWYTTSRAVQASSTQLAKVQASTPEARAAASTVATNWSKLSTCSLHRHDAPLLHHALSRNAPCARGRGGEAGSSGGAGGEHGGHCARFSAVCNEGSADLHTASAMAASTGVMHGSSLAV